MLDPFENNNRCYLPLCVNHTRVLLDNPLNEELARVDQDGDDVRDAAEANDVGNVEEDGRKPGLLQNEETRAPGDDRVEGARETPLKHDAPQQQRRDTLDVGHERDGGLLERGSVILGDGDGCGDIWVQ